MFDSIKNIFKKKEPIVDKGPFEIISDNKHKDAEPAEVIKEEKHVIDVVQALYKDNERLKRSNNILRRANELHAIDYKRLKSAEGDLKYEKRRNLSLVRRLKRTQADAALNLKLYTDYQMANLQLKHSNEKLKGALIISIVTAIGIALATYIIL